MNSSTEVLFLGKIAVDIVFKKGNNKNLLLPLSLSPGGSIFNTAAILSRLGIRGGIFSQISGDPLGKYLSEFLEKEKLNTKFIKKSLNSKTPLAIALIDKNGIPEYSFYKDDSPSLEIEFQKAGAVFKKLKAVYLGSSFSYSDATFKISEKFLNIAKNNGITAFYDPNIRPGQITHPAQARQRIEKLISKVDILKLSEDDLSFISGSGNLKDSLKKLNKRINACIILTLGKNGAIFLDKKGMFLEIKPFKVNVKDTIGAGDAFGAGLLFKFCKSRGIKNFFCNMKENMIFAAGASAITCSGYGALRIKNLNEVNSFIKNHRNEL